MSKKHKFYGEIEDATLKFYSPDWVEAKMQELGDCKIIVTVEKDNGKRSNPTNNYLHGIVFPLVLEVLRDAGYERIKTMQDAKDFVKEKFLKEDVINEETGECIGTITKHTADLSQEESNVFIEEIAQWLAEYFYTVLPPPSSQSKLFAV